MRLCCSDDMIWKWLHKPRREIWPVELELLQTPRRESDIGDPGTAPSETGGLLVSIILRRKAQREETRLAALWGCEAHPGGAGPEYALWYVYAFEHDGY